MPDWLTPFYSEAAVTVCSIELLTALLLLYRRFSLFASCASALLLSFFVWLTGINLFFPSIFGSIESCGCFGELIHFSPAGSFAKSVAIWGMSAALVSIQIRNSVCKDAWRKTDALHLLACLLVSILPSAYSLLFMSRLTESLYVAGYVVICSAVICFAIIVITRHVSRKPVNVNNMSNTKE